MGEWSWSDRQGRGARLPRPQPLPQVRDPLGLEFAHLLEVALGMRFRQFGAQKLAPFLKRHPMVATGEMVGFI